MKSSDYWKKRFELLESEQNKIGLSAYSRIEKQYRDAEKQIEGKISAWYERFAANNEISMAEARQWLKGDDLDEFKWTVQEYIKHGEENAINGKWVKQLENASAKYHISKYEALKIEMQDSLETMFSKQQETMSSALADAYESSYYHTAYEIQHGLRVGVPVAGLDQAQIEKVLSSPWAADGTNFSEKIWTSREKLMSSLQKELTQNIMLGKDPQSAIDAIARQMKTSKYNAGRLVMTEEAYFSSAAQKDCFEDLGVEEYEIVATLDSRTSEICQTMDGQHFPMKDYEAGVTAPPFHPWCRSTTCPYFEDDHGQTGQRIARGEDGKQYNVPADMDYKEWKETFADGDTSGLLELKEDENDGIILSGARITDIESDEADKFAEMYYDEIRSFSTDCEKIATNLDRDADDIKRIKSYLFMDKSLYDDESGQYKRFAPDCAIAQSWQRLMTGKNIQKHDRTLIEHELCEMEIKKENPEIEHLVAHSMANEKYNYQKEAAEYYGGLKKHNKK
ncbi:MAG: minor capsid protein [Clostridiales bacterium]|nr:minor capsid protein [Clostridiales bacterium]